MKIHVLLVYIYTLKNEYYGAVLIDMETEEAVYFSSHGDPAYDQEVLNIYCDGLSYAHDVTCTEISTSIDILPDESVEELGARLCDILFHTEKQIFGQESIDLN